MSDAVRNSDTDNDGSVRAFGRALVPIIIAAASVALVVVAIRSHAVTLDEVTAGPDEPAVYSAAEARVPPPPAQAEEPPAPTF
jgi:hypothetical protein